MLYFTPFHIQKNTDHQQGINQWYTSAATFQYNAASIVAENSLPGDLTRTSDQLGFVASVWNGTVAYGCAFAVCSDAFHTEMMCMFSDASGELPMLLENKADIDSNNRAIVQDVNLAIAANVMAPSDPCPTSYVTRAGDSLENVARQFNTTPGELMCFNSQIGPMTQIGLGGVPLLIPCPGMAPPSCMEYQFVTRMMMCCLGGGGLQWWLRWWLRWLR